MFVILTAWSFYVDDIQAVLCIRTYIVTSLHFENRKTFSSSMSLVNQLSCMCAFVHDCTVCIKFLQQCVYSSLAINAIVQSKTVTNIAMLMTPRSLQ